MVWWEGPGTGVFSIAYSQVTVIWCQDETHWSEGLQCFQKVQSIREFLRHFCFTLPIVLAKNSLQKKGSSTHNTNKCCVFWSGFSLSLTELSSSIDIPQANKGPTKGKNKNKKITKFLPNECPSKVGTYITILEFTLIIFVPPSKEMHSNVNLFWFFDILPISKATSWVVKKVELMLICSWILNFQKVCHSIEFKITISISPEYDLIVCCECLKYIIVFCGHRFSLKIWQ